MPCGCSRSIELCVHSGGSVAEPSWRTHNKDRSLPLEQHLAKPQYAINKADVVVRLLVAVGQEGGVECRAFWERCACTMRCLVAHTMARSKGWLSSVVYRNTHTPARPATRVPGTSLDSSPGSTILRWH